MYYDRHGKPISLMEWACKHEDLDYIRVRQDWARGWMISTVWLGLNHNWMPGGVPLIFETMIFAPGDVSISGRDDLDQFQERYATEEAALAGHGRALTAVVVKLGPGSEAEVCGPMTEADLGKAHLDS